MRLTQEYTGRSLYHGEYEEGAHRLVVAVECRIEAFPNPVFALLDTGSYWCVLDPAIAEALEYSAEPADEHYLTRFGRLQGRLHRIPLLFPAHDGTALEVNATWFVCSDWKGPTVIGWKGCLERICFALNPGQDQFYFAAESHSAGEATQP